MTSRLLFLSILPYFYLKKQRKSGLTSYPFNFVLASDQAVQDQDSLCHRVSLRSLSDDDYSSLHL